MAYELAEHRHRFAVWAAARAAQRGFTELCTLREALECTDIRRTVITAMGRNVTAEEVDSLHRGWCSAIHARLTEQGIAKTTYGRVAKLVAVYLKTIVLMGDGYRSPLAHHMHPPIDRRLLRALAASKSIVSTHKSRWRSINWTQLDEPSYQQLISQLRRALPAKLPFWTIEEYWQPSDIDDDGVS